jgi:hypothetical protein
MLSNRLVFSLVLCAIVFPMLALEKMSDPLSGTRWSQTTSSNSGIVPYIIALIYAGVTSILLRRKKTASRAEYFIAGSLISLVPGLFYLLVTPFATTRPPLVFMFILGFVFGPIFGGSAFVMLRRDNTKLDGVA